MITDNNQEGLTMDDKRLERLYDYTKFHIGIYLSVAAGLAALISLAADHKLAPILGVIRFPSLFGLAFLAMVVAGVAGAFVATTAIRVPTYDDFKKQTRGTRRLEFKAETWVTIEHYSFWLSLFLIALGVFSSQNVLAWILSRGHERPPTGHSQLCEAFDMQIRSQLLKAANAADISLAAMTASQANSSGCYSVGAQH